MSEWVMIVFFVAGAGNTSVATIDFASQELCEAALPNVAKVGASVGAGGKSAALCVQRHSETIRKKLRDLKPKA